MSTFPALIPSSRTLTPGEYAVTAFAGYSGKQNRVRHSNVFLAAQLRLSFVGLSEAQMLQIWSHYNGRRGDFRSFALPAEIVSNGSITDYVPGIYLWKYAGPGSVEDLPCGGHNVSLTLETVPPSSASVIGAELFVGIGLSDGAANSGEYETGISESLTFSIQAGSAFTALNGISESLALGLEPGDADGDVEIGGINLFVFMNLLNGLGANDGRYGIDETINLSLAAGTANENAGGTDPDFASVSLLLHMDGSNGSTTFTDSSSNALTVTANNNAEISTAQSKFGGASGLFNGDGAYLLVPDDGTAIGTGDFTIECWIRITLGTGYRGIVSLVPGSDNNTLYVLADTIIWYDSGNQAASAQLSSNTWYHVAVARESGTLRTFVDGVESSTDYTSTANIASNTARIGTRGGANGEWYNGYIDDLRITKGVARYTANFTPPTAAFPDS